MKLDEFTADEPARTDLGLSEDKDWIYEDEAEMRRAIEEYIDVLCSDSAEFSEVEVRACFDGISRPEEIFEEMLLLDDVDNEEDEEVKIPWISGLCSAVICNLRRQYRFCTKTAVLLCLSASCWCGLGIIISESDIFHVFETSCKVSNHVTCCIHANRIFTLSYECRCESICTAEGEEKTSWVNV